MRVMITARIVDNQQEWDTRVQRLGGHPLQLWGWGEVKAAHGWRAQRVALEEGGKVIGVAQVLYRRMPKPMKNFAYVPRGPVCRPSDRPRVLQALATYVRREGKSFVLSVEPHWNGFPVQTGWRRAYNTILLPRTATLDLTKSLDGLQETMSKKTRQYIRKSEREGLETRKLVTDAEVKQALKIYRETATRAHFDLHGDDYYLDIFHSMGGNSPVYAAFKGKEMVAFLWLAATRAYAFELYGGVNDRGQELRANYILKWTAITEQKEQGTELYDLNGLLNDGIINFKLGFVSEETHLAGTWDYPLSSLYGAWNSALPLVKRAVRRVKKLRR